MPYNGISAVDAVVASHGSGRWGRLLNPFLSHALTAFAGAVRAADLGLIWPAGWRFLRAALGRTRYALVRAWLRSPAARPAGIALAEAALTCGRRHGYMITYSSL